MHSRILRFLVFHGLLACYVAILVGIGPYLAELFLVTLFIWFLAKWPEGNPAGIDADIDRIATWTERGTRIALHFLLQWLKGL